MLKIKYLILLCFLFASTINYGQFTDVINSNRPGKSMSAFSVGETVFQAELGFYGLKEKHDLQKYEANGFGSDLSLRYGAFLEELEFSLDLQYQKEWYTAPLVDKSNGGLKQTIIGAKFLIYDPLKKYQDKKPNLYSWKANHKFTWRQFIPAIGIYGGLNINLSNDAFLRPGIPQDPKVSPKGMLITQNQFGRFVLVTNIILDKFPYKNKSIDYVVTLTHGFNSRWSGFIENQGFNNSYYSDGIFRGGAAYLMKQNIQIDAAIGANYKDTPSILTGGIGMSWRFDKNYTDLLIRVNKEKKGKDKKDKKDKKNKKDKKGKKEKEKTKKRADEVDVEKTN